MSALSRGIARLSKRRKKQRELPAIIEQDQQPTTPTELFPTHLAEVLNSSKPSLLGRSMDRIRRSIRQSFRRNRSQESHPPALVNMPERTGRAEAWQPDEAAVRAGVCSFPVKYLGATEVYESRGMPVCEGALKHLRTQKRQPVKAILYVSGDGLRVVDQENSRGLMVDQTIEKVSFCAPDRNNDKGFAYICRDGTSRRWMCHGFHASKDSGERLSHAVGCAFSICLEKKKKRDEENMLSEKPITAEKALNPDWGDKMTDGPSTASPSINAQNGHSMQRTNNAYQSFRKQISISDRLQDPQSAILNGVPSSSIHQTLPCIAKPRPVANPALFQRQGSLRAPETSQSSQFRRNFSLRAPTASADSPKRNFGTVLNNEPIYEGDEDNLVSFAPMQCISSTPASTSFSTTPSTTKMTTSFSGFGDFSSPSHASISNGYAAPPITVAPQHDLMNFNDLMDFNKPISVNTQYSPPTVSAAPLNNSKADDWLNNTLKTSLSFGSPAELNHSPSMGSIRNGMGANNQYYANIPVIPSNSFPTAGQSKMYPNLNQHSGPPPTMAPPPIPQRPPGVAVDNANNQISQMNGTTAQLKTNGTNVTDTFGQSINWEQTSPRHVPKPEDPFDIQWSKMTISANNPFASEQPRIST